jgi:hypothetical protein
MTARYTTYGPVRDQCGHAHETYEAAKRCARRDQSGCASQGAYSDRLVVIIGADGYLYHDDTPSDVVRPPHGRSCGAVRFEP